MGVTLYSTGCPQCQVLIKKLSEKNVEFNEITDIKEIRKMGFLSVPHLVVDDSAPMNFSEAVKWVNSLEG